MLVTRIIIKDRGNNPYFFSVQSVAGAIILFLIPTTTVFPHQQSMTPSKRHFSPVIAWCRSQAHFRHNFKLSSSPYNWKLLLLVAPHDTINHLMLERSLKNFAVNGHFARAEDSSNFHGPEPALDELLEAFELAAALEDKWVFRGVSCPADAVFGVLQLCLHAVADCPCDCATVTG